MIHLNLSKNETNIIKPFLKKKVKKKKFRNSSGNLVFYHRSHGHKKKYRTNFITNFNFNSGVVVDYQYDPYKNSPSCLVFTENNSFVLLPCIEGVSIGFLVEFKTKKFAKGHYSCLKHIPVNSIISYIWDNYSNKFIYARAAGSFCTLLSKIDKYALIKLKSGILKIISIDFFCFFGKVANWTKSKKKIYRKAGRNKWLGLRPVVRGVAMNPIDHPHGGGEGKTSGGRPSVSPWGKLTKGVPSVNTGLNKYLKARLIRKYF